MHKAQRQQASSKFAILVSETGAVFAFGRSHLTITGDGSDNNYFFIKQSAVICGEFCRDN